MLSGIQPQLSASSNLNLVQNLHAKPNKLKLPSVLHYSLLHAFSLLASDKMKPLAFQLDSQISEHEICVHL